MPALFGEQRPESVQAFFIRTNPFPEGPGENREQEARLREADLRRDIGKRRRSIEYAGHETPPPGDILLAREIVSLGVANITRLERERGSARLFPGGYGFDASPGFTNLPTADQDLIRYSYAAVVFGVIVEAMYDTFTDPINSSGSIYFNRIGFANRLNEVMSPTNFYRIDPDRHIPSGTTNNLDAETKSEKLSVEDSNKLRDYIERTGTYDFLTETLELRMPESIRRFLQLIPSIRALIIQTPENPESSLRTLYHERATVLIEHEQRMEIARRLLSEGVDAPPDADEPTTPMPNFMYRDDWNV